MLCYKTVLDSEWGKVEIQKPYEKMHSIIQWYQLTLKYLNQKFVHGTISSAPMTGATEAFLQLSYNLYLLAHNEELQDDLIKRLIDRNEFPGVLYEIFVYANLIKAGFKIEFEDESNRDWPHCECVAVHKLSRKKYSVEAKSIRKKGVLGDDESSNQRTMCSAVKRLLKSPSKESGPSSNCFY